VQQTIASSTLGATLGAATGAKRLWKDGLGWLFLAYAVPAVLFHAIAMPPFQVADELSHVFRSSQVRHRIWVSPRLGGNVDRGLVAFGDPYMKMWFHRDVKLTVPLAEEGGALRWSCAQEKADFWNTAQYGPVLYIPQAIGLWIGQKLDFTIAQTVCLSRIVNGLVSCIVGYFAIALCGRGRVFLFAMLLFPMTLSQMASASQDALLITLTMLAVAVASKLLAEQRPATLGEFAVFAFIVAATTLARPSQIALAFLAPAYFTRNDPTWVRKTLLGVMAFVPIISWYLLLRDIMSPWPPGVSVSGQFHYILHQPLALPKAILNSCATNGRWYLETIVGNLGWTDTPMPGWYYLCAAVVTAFAFGSPGNRGRLLWPTILAVVTLGGFVAAQFGALYLTWTPMRQPIIDGFQGRYVLPFLPLLGWLMPTCGPRLERALGLLRYVVLLFPIVSLGVLPYAIMERFYGSWSEMGEATRALLMP
jgi:uncharacterized membrane protein